MPTPRRAYALARVIRDINTISEEVSYVDGSLVPVTPAPALVQRTPTECTWRYYSPVRRPHAYSI